MPDALPQTPHEMMKEPDYEFLDVGQTRVFADASGRMRLTIEGDRSYIDVKIVRAFPVSDPDHFIGFLKSGDKLIGLVRDPGQLDEPSRETIARALRQHYFVPAIQRIHEMQEEFGAVYFDVETERGRREFVVKGIRDTLEDLGDGQLLISDVEGNRYRFANWHELDRRSRRYLERML